MELDVYMTILFGLVAMSHEAQGRAGAVILAFVLGPLNGREPAPGAADFPRRRDRIPDASDQRLHS